MESSNTTIASATDLRLVEVDEPESSPSCDESQVSGLVDAHGSAGTQVPEFSGDDIHGGPSFVQARVI